LPTAKSTDVVIAPTQTGRQDIFAAVRSLKTMAKRMVMRINEIMPVPRLVRI